ncbi:MAG TPA: hypothetical protein DET40_14885 [Lentisphaeria bacterium]|nr:MAG: hypothetical protein A2X45_06160 [Lentisphaerae bacterium GWF2_50_93]HCE44823.1 hypothetical protein [Lentisphaeria bacterium]
MKAISRIISALIAVAYVVLVYVFRGGASAMDAGMLLLIPLACIWFSDELGGSSSEVGEENVKRTPAKLIAILGWIILVTPIVFWLISTFSTDK